MKKTIGYQIKVDGKYGIIDQFGSIVMEPSHDLLSFCVDGLATAIDGGQCFIINGDRTIRVTDDVKYLFSSISNLFLAKTEDYACGYIGPDGDWKIKPSFHEARSFHFGMAVVKDCDSNLYKVINTLDENVFSSEWDYISDFSEEGAVARCENEWFLLKTSGEAIRVGESNDMTPPSEGVIGYQKKEKGRLRWRFLDMDMNPYLPNEYFASVRRFSSGICASKITNEYRFIDLAGNHFSSRGFKNAGVFYNGLCPAKSLVKGEKWGAVNIDGEWVVDPVYDGCDHLPIDSQATPELCGSLIQVWTGDYVVDNGKIGYYDYSGGMVWSPKR